MGRTSRRLWVWPLLVVLLWLFVGGPLGSFAGRLAEVQENDNAAFLPQSAESTEVLDTLVGFQEEETLPVTVVFERSGGLTPEDQQAIADLSEELADVDNVASGGVGQPIPSEDGEAAQVVVQVATTDGEEIVTAVEDMRAVLDDPPDGLTALVGGQGGVLGDFVDAFGAIDGVLLRRGRLGRAADPAARLPDADPAARRRVLGACSRWAWPRRRSTPWPPATC